MHARANLMAILYHQKRLLLVTDGYQEQNLPFRARRRYFQNKFVGASALKLVQISRHIHGSIVPGGVEGAWRTVVNY